MRSPRGEKKAPAHVSAAEAPAAIRAVEYKSSLADRRQRIEVDEITGARVTPGRVEQVAGPLVRLRNKPEDQT